MTDMTTSIKAFFLAATLSTTVFSTSVALAAGESTVKITPDVASVEVMHNGKKTTIARNQDEKHLINPDFAKTSRKCPPFCIQP